MIGPNVKVSSVSNHSHSYGKASRSVMPRARAVFVSVFGSAPGPLARQGTLVRLARFLFTFYRERHVQNAEQRGARTPRAEPAPARHAVVTQVACVLVCISAVCRSVHKDRLVDSAEGFVSVTHSAPPQHSGGRIPRTAFFLRCCAWVVHAWQRDARPLVKVYVLPRPERSSRSHSLTREVEVHHYIQSCSLHAHNHVYTKSFGNSQFRFTRSVDGEHLLLHGQH